MSDGFVKIYSDILQSSLWLEDPSVLKVWLTLLALGGPDGVVSASIPGLAHSANVPLEDCEAALNKFLAPDPYSRDPENEGRRIAVVDGGFQILNQSKYRDRRSKKQMQTAARVQRYRDRHKEDSVTSVTSVTCNARNAASRPKTPEAEAEAEADSNTPPTASDPEPIKQPGEPSQATVEAEAPKSPTPSEQFRTAWNGLAAAAELRQCRKLGESRQKALRARLRDPDWRERYQEALDRLRGVKWIRGANKENWVANIDWFLRPETVNRILEGGYDDNGNTSEPLYTPDPNWKPF